ncbi:MAG: hypothetical protein AVDCRST_MAG34-153 [uncultured Nocardioidaceae bacterium]|uniref:Uncharacterized protein n=1 Tax=uncultured Nocardioidaceae bacterium TaxID=253824 RepID=A0A6J4LBZ0_9ACTN|nr:MAG: hypothetical protein AVDCRST_MAG34-153 [uncultured Nocardioidaceae bacterium]
MIELAVWLAVIGVCDLVRAARDITSVRRRALIATGGGLLLLAGALAVEVTAARTFLLLLGWGSCFLLWLLGSAAALGGGGSGARTLAFVGMGGGLAFGLLGSDVVGPLTRHLPGPLGRFGVEEATLLLGVLLAQLATGNVVVRLLLDAVGVPATPHEKQLKGGRVLGPMERLVIVGLGASGHFTAASVVVAAKGLLRFPELQREVRGASDVTEYFLIGSFASWMLALAGVAALGLSQAIG